MMCKQSVATWLKTSHGGLGTCPLRCCVPSPPVLGGRTAGSPGRVRHCYCCSSPACCAIRFHSAGVPRCSAVGPLLDISLLSSVAGAVFTSLIGVRRIGSGSTTAEIIPARIAPRVRHLILSFWTLQDCFAVVAIAGEYVELVEGVLINFQPEPEPIPLLILFPYLQDRDRHHGARRYR